jgi:hypothetical protein
VIMDCNWGSFMKSDKNIVVGESFHENIVACLINLS